MSLDTSARPPTSATIRAVLQEHHRARQDQIKALTLNDPDSSDPDPGARVRALSAARLVLTEIDQALLRLDDGSYGFCVGCAAPIPAERLEVVPYARHCVACA